MNAVTHLHQLKQAWKNVSEQHPGKIVLIRSGYFFETFGEHAKAVSKLTGEPIYQFTSDRPKMVSVVSWRQSQVSRVLAEAGYSSLWLGWAEEPPKNDGKLIMEAH